MPKRITVLALVALALILVCVGAATIDSCKRQNKSCFGITSTK